MITMNEGAANTTRASGECNTRISSQQRMLTSQETCDGNQNKFYSNLEKGPAVFSSSLTKGSSYHSNGLRQDED